MLNVNLYKGIAMGSIQPIANFDTDIFNFNFANSEDAFLVTGNLINSLKQYKESNEMILEQARVNSETLSKENFLLKMKISQLLALQQEERRQACEIIKLQNDENQLKSSELEILKGKIKIIHGILEKFQIFDDTHQPLTSAPYNLEILKLLVANTLGESNQYPE